MARGRPINADVPAAKEPARPAAETEPKPKPDPASRPAPPRPTKPPRRPIPGALKAIAGLVVLALAFIVA
ncbi:MAG TPA: hypothetical protein VF259_05095, partial [Solirubrobacterales bacterium]